jgi:hypothetical protein
MKGSLKRIFRNPIHRRREIKYYPEGFPQNIISKKAGFIGRQKYRLGRGQSYISIINTMLLIGIAFKIKDLILIITVGIVTLFIVWLMGFADDRYKIVHAESQHSVESVNPYFQELRGDIKEIKRMLQKMRMAK